MSIENGKCPSCCGALLLDSSKEKAICKFCGHEVFTHQAVQKSKIDGIATFDTRLLSAQRALEFDEDFDKAANYYKEALELSPDDYRALWGLFLCDIAAISYAKNFKGYVQIPGDIQSNIQNSIRRFGNRAYANAPNELKPYYFREIQKIQNSFQESSPNSPKKKGCYIATSIYGSYDCPEVWVLRRYRDIKLDSFILGKIFIKLYYFISPIMVKCFGNRKMFKKIWKKRLNKKVQKLKQLGFEDTPYFDKY